MWGQGVIGAAAVVAYLYRTQYPALAFRAGQSDPLNAPRAVVAPHTTSPPAPCR